MSDSDKKRRDAQDEIVLEDPVADIKNNNYKMIQQIKKMSDENIRFLVIIALISLGVLLLITLG
jgi:hypothetical protein